MLPLTPAAQAQVEDILDQRVLAARPVGGGCINDNFGLETESGTSAFLKWNARAPEGFFQAEVEGLEALRAAALAGPDQPALRVPRVLGTGEAPSGAWLLLEYIEAGQPDREYWKRLAAGLSTLHASEAGPEAPNFLGPLPQAVEPHENWSSFWIEERLLPRLGDARERGYISGADDRAWDVLLGALPRALPRMGPSGLGLLHGDLWSGNVFPDTDGTPVLVDPAIYLGDGRVDLAMAELFGGFSTTFFQAYEVARPSGPAYRALLRDAYQLYPLLVHIVLFGHSYVTGAMDRVRRLTANLAG